jgi:hypothetical protein|tara:strand:- start:832 stop:1044 length:213 start_codon:yes stop_codon:yes gene_type:complete
MNNKIVLLGIGAAILYFFNKGKKNIPKKELDQAAPVKEGETSNPGNVGPNNPFVQNEVPNPNLDVVYSNE